MGKCTIPRYISVLYFLITGNNVRALLAYIHRRFMYNLHFSSHRCSRGPTVYIEEWRGEQKIFTPREQLHPCVSKFAPRGEIKRRPQASF
jgi:hypothetical protein